MEAENTEDRVTRALSDIIDPETGLSIMRMDLIQDLEVTAGGCVNLVFRPSSPVCPMAYSLANAIKKCLQTIDGVSSIHIRVENFEKAAHLESLLQQPAPQL